MGDKGDNGRRGPQGRQTNGNQNDIFAIFYFKIAKERKAKLAPLECKVRRAKKVTWEIVEQVLVSCTLLETLQYTRTHKRIDL